MSDAQRDLFGFLGAALGVIVGLFVVQELYGSFLDVQAHAQLAEVGVFPELAAVRDAEAKKLAAAKVPIDEAMGAVAERGRAGIRSVAPVPSDDLSAMSGWIHRKGFTAYVPRTAQAAVPAAVQPPPSEVAAPEEAPTGERAPVPEAAAAEGQE